MKISTKGLYAVRFMLNLAERGGDKLVSLKEVSEAESVSKKSLEQIGPKVGAAQRVKGVLACEDDFDCSQPHICIEIGVWKGLDKLIKDYLSGITLQDILNQASSVAADSYSI